MAAAELCGRAIVGKTAGVVKFCHRAVFLLMQKNIRAKFQNLDKIR